MILVAVVFTFNFSFKCSMHFFQNHHWRKFNLNIQKSFNNQESNWQDFASHFFIVNVIGYCEPVITVFVNYSSIISF